ncbi:hypothetical protein ADJ73_05120 [Arsenicicoccus sp. oral taxon 190]|nr:hypothetical protein ADJ73_05120 [Arsenicicoccus sp. oral taxon 190]
MRLLLGGRPSVWGLLVPVVLVVAGLLFAASAVTAKGSSLRASDTRGLADVVASQDRTLSAKESRVADLRDQVKTLSARNAPSGSSATALTDAAARLNQPAGMEAVRGPALQVTMTDSTRSVDSFGGQFSADDLVIHQQDVQAVVNALWSGGAEAMMIQDQRVISTSAVRCVGNTLILHNRVYSPPFVIKAIGDTGSMRRALDQDSSVQVIQQYVAAVGLGYDVLDLGDQTFPAYDGSVTLQHATVAK